MHFPLYGLDSFPCAIMHKGTCLKKHVVVFMHEAYSFPGGVSMVLTKHFRGATMPEWTFLTNHGLVLTYIGNHRDSTGLEIAQAVGITERAARKIVAGLQADGYIEREKVGRRNHYHINSTQRLPYLAEHAVTVGELIGLLRRAQDQSEP